MDSSLARSTFFGRQNECALLKAQVIANRLTVVYARSGIGKTSLLNAGLHQALRDEGYLPLMVRINDLQRTVLDCIFDTMPELAERQSVEINDGSRRSLWHYFKTVEFWKQDLLLQPVLILDQFEELFTLRSLSDQDNLLREIGHLVRGDAPVGTSKNRNRV
jgi:AAA+ ATPase superfamily predicted ATPase